MTVHEPEPRVDRAEAVDALRDLNFAVQAFREAVAGYFAVGVRETQAAAYLVTHGQLSAGDLSRLLDLTPSTVTHLLGRIQRADLAVVTTDPTDQRRSVVRPTDRARAIVTEVRSWLDSCFDGFADADVPLEVVVSVVNVLSAGLQDVRATLQASPKRA